MGARIPSLPREDFLSEIEALAPAGSSRALREALWLHFLELQRWNPRLSLVGPADTEHPSRFLRRHYGEALAALPLLDESAKVLVDLGSGGGFPALILSAARPDIRVILVEPSQRKRSFLEAVIRRAALPCQCLNARVSAALPAGFPDEIDILTVRALKVAPEAFRALRARLSGSAQVLLWAGAEVQAPPEGFRRGRTSEVLAGSRERHIVEWRWGS